MYLEAALPETIEISPAIALFNNIPLKEFSRI
jgi:hypothetical protein